MVQFLAPATDVMGERNYVEGEGDFTESCICLKCTISGPAYKSIGNVDLFLIRFLKNVWRKFKRHELWTVRYVVLLHESKACCIILGFQCPLGAKAYIQEFVNYTQIQLNIFFILQCIWNLLMIFFHLILLTNLPKSIKKYILCVKVKLRFSRINQWFT